MTGFGIKTAYFTYHYGLGTYLDARNVLKCSCRSPFITSTFIYYLHGEVLEIFRPTCSP